jgi:DNA-binding HxlR family transcriptional regulator
MLQTGVEQQEPRPRAHGVWTPIARALTATGDRWTLMIVLALAPGRTRLTELHRCLPGVTTGVLDRHLQRMVAGALVTRTRSERSPPRVELELTDAGRELLAISGMLARWGMRNRWSAPSDQERVDIGALLRMLPTLFDEHPALPDGATVEAQVASAHRLVIVFFHVQDGHLEIDEVVEQETGLPSRFSRPGDAVDRHRQGATGAPSPPSSATVSLQGDEQAWIAALGPAGDHKHLRLDGETMLAREVLNSLPRVKAVAR